MRFLAVVLAILGVGAVLMFAGSWLRGDTLGQWLFGFMAVFLGVAAGMAWGEDEK